MGVKLNKSPKKPVPESPPGGFPAVPAPTPEPAPEPDTPAMPGGYPPPEDDDGA